MARMTNGWRLAAAAALSLFLAGGACAQEADVKADARLLFEEALKQKKSGKLEDAVKTFEKAIRKDRSVLSEDDDGLVGMLRNSYALRLASAPEDIQLLEGMGFISAVCDSNLPKAIELYGKIITLTPDEAVKARTQQLVDRLTAQVDAARQQTDEFSSRSREERLKTWSEMEKSDALAAQAEINAQREGRLADLYRTREEKESRIPQLEDEVGSLDDERERWHRMYLNTNDRRYKRKEDKAEADVEAKKKEIERLKSDVEKAKEEIYKLTKEDPTAVANKTGTATGGPTGVGAPMTPDDPNAAANPDGSMSTTPPPDGFPGDPGVNPAPGPDSGAPAPTGVLVSPDDPTVVRPDGTTGLDNPSDPGAPSGVASGTGSDAGAMPPSNPDFPSDAAPGQSPSAPPDDPTLPETSPSAPSSGN